MKVIEKSQKRAKCFKINQKYGKLMLIDFVIFRFSWMKNWLTISEEVTEIRIMTSKLIIIFEGGDALEVSRLPQRPNGENELECFHWCCLRTNC